MPGVDKRTEQVLGLADATNLYFMAGWGVGGGAGAGAGMDKCTKEVLFKGHLASS